MASTSESDDINESSTIDPDDSTISTDDFQTTSSFVDEEESDKSLKDDEDPEKSSITENPTEIKEPDDKETKSSEDVDGASPSDQDAVDAEDPSFDENRLKEILEASDETSTFAENKLQEILQAGDDSEGNKEDEDDKEDKISQGNSEDANVEYREDATTESIDAESSEQDISREASEDAVNINDDEDEEGSTTETKDKENTEQDKVSEKSVDGDVENRDSSILENKDVKTMPESPAKEQELGDDDHVEKVDSPTIGDKDAEDLVEIEKEIESNDNLINDDDETFAKNENEEESSTMEDMGMIAGDVEKDTGTPGLAEVEFCELKEIEKSAESITHNDVQKSIEMDNDHDRIDDVTETNQIIDNTSVDDKITDEHITNNTVQNVTGDSGDEDNSTENDARMTENSLSVAQREIEKSIDTLEVEDPKIVSDDTETELKEIEKSADSITHAPEAAHVVHSHSGSFDASVEHLKSDEQQPTEPDPDPGPDSMEGFEDVELSESNGLTEEAGDMEKYMEQKADEERVLIENEQRQRTGSDQPKSESEAVKSNLKPSSVAKLANVSFSDDAETDSLHSMEESDHFKDRKKPAVPLDALRSDASSTDGSQSKSNNHRQTSYGSITVPEDKAEDTCCKCPKCYPTGFFVELKNISRLVWPMFFIQFFQFLFGPVVLMYCGHEGTEVFLGAAVALSVINMVGIPIAVGLGNACDTVFAQLRKSAHKEDIVIAFQRGILFALLAVMPCYALHLNAESILLAIGLQPVICSIAADYLLVFIPGLLAFFLYILASKFIQNHKKVYFVLWIGFVSNLVNVMLHFVLVFEMSLGARGSSISLTCTYIFMLLLTVMYLYWAGFVKSAWDLRWRSESFQEWGSFFLLAFPCIISSCAEWWTVEIGLFLAGHIGMRELGTQAVLIQLEIICYLFSLGLAAATTIRITQRLRLSEGQSAKTLARVALAVALFNSIFLVILLYVLHTLLPYMFTPDSDMVNLATSLIPIMCLYIFFDSFLVVCGGIFRACGRFVLGAVIAVIGFVASVVVGVLLMFHNTPGLKGWWIALGAVCAVEGLLCIIVNLFTNWENQVKKAKVRNSHYMMMSTSKSSSSGGKQGEKDALLAAKEKDFTASYDDYYSKEYDFNASYEHPTRTYSGPQSYEPAQPSESLRRRKNRRSLATWQLVLRRGSVILLFVGILASGVVLRFFV